MHSYMYADGKILTSWFLLCCYVSEIADYKRIGLFENPRSTAADAVIAVRRRVTCAARDQHGVADWTTRCDVSEA